MSVALPAVLVDPESFFEHESDDPDFAGPIVIVTVLAIVTIAAAVPVFQSLSSISFVQQTSGSFLFGLFVGVYVRWFVIALLFYGLSALFRGEGRFLNVFFLVGWGYIPQIFSTMVEGVITSLLLSNRQFSTLQEAQQYIQGAQTTPLGFIDFGFGLLMTLWAAWILTHAVADARDLHLRHAAISVGIVVFAHILLGLLSTFT